MCCRRLVTSIPSTIPIEIFKGAIFFRKKLFKKTRNMANNVKAEIILQCVFKANCLQNVPML